MVENPDQNILPTLTPFLPLPKGEGRDEGKSDSLESASQSLSAIPQTNPPIPNPKLKNAH